MRREQNNRHSHIIIMALILVLLCGVGSIYCFILVPARNATVKYNEAVNAYNDMASNYDEALKNVCVDNIEGISDSAGTLQNESEQLSDIISALIQGNSTDKIVSDTETIYKLIDSMEDDLEVVAQITNPTADWVVQRLTDVEQITEMAVASEDNDPGHLLGKDGGYTSCVYFNISDIELMDGETVLEKGTDAGGAIEVYATVRDAEARCDYLAGFDGTLMYSGSYAIVGTMVIRTSYILDGTDQLELTNEITQSFTKP